MRIDGKGIAQHILAKLTGDVATLRDKGIIPTLSVILVGNDSASLSYIRQKEKACQTITATLALTTKPDSITREELAELIATCNINHSIHGVIVQRPVPTSVGDVKNTIAGVNPQKDVDGFVPNSKFDPPVARAVVKILEQCYKQKNKDAQSDVDSFVDWLKEQKIGIVGRGETAGKPIDNLLQKLNCTTSVIHSKTTSPYEILIKSDIIISCVGKESVITNKNIKKGVILLSVGIWRDSEGKLQGDYEEDEVRDIASFYTPTPGGVGPVNVACLMENLVNAAKKSYS